MSSARAETPAAFILSMLAAYARYGVDPTRALTGAGLKINELRYPQARVTAQQMEQFTVAAMRELDDEALGWFTRRLPYGTSGMLCRASLVSDRLGIAMARWCRHYGFLQDSIRLHLEVGSGVARLELHECVDLGFQREFCVVSTFRNIIGYSCWLADSQLPLLDAAFPFRAPAHVAAYRHMFHCEARFDQPLAAVSFDAASLELPVRRTDRELRQMLTRPIPLIVLQYRRDRLLARSVRERLRENPIAGGADDIAFELHMSTRSLYRHLADEGTSFQALKDEARRDTAIELLLRTQKSLKQIAANAGFKGEASFHRAFKQWTGIAPGEYRDQTKRSS